MIKPHRKQKKILNSTKKRILVCTGRRFGKTVLAALIALKYLNLGTRVLYVTPISVQADAFWSYIIEYLGTTKVEINQVKRTIRLGTGIIQCYTAWNIDSLRGTSGEVIILDEFAQMKPDIWKLIILPMTLDKNAKVYFFSTPLPSGPFKTIYMRAKGTRRWKVYEGSSYDNIYLNKVALREIEKEYSGKEDPYYQQEVLGKFVAGQGAVFGNITPNLYTPGTEVMSEHKNHSLIFTIDWGSKRDNTSISIGCMDCKKEIELIILKRMDYPIQRAKIIKLNEDYKPTLIVAEANSMGLPNIENLWNERLNVVPFTTTQESKRQIINSLRLALELETWKFIDLPEATAELEVYEVKLNPLGQPIYGSPSGFHDDTVISRAIMVYKAEHGRINLS